MAVESDFISTLTAEGIEPQKIRGSKTAVSMTVGGGNFRIDVQSDDRYDISTTGSCSGTIAGREEKMCTIIYNDTPPRNTIEVEQLFKASTAADLAATFKPLEYTLKKIEKIDNVKKDQPAFFDTVPASVFDRTKYPEGMAALALTVKVKNLNNSGVEGTNYQEPSLQNIAKIKRLGAEVRELEPVQVIDAPTVEPLSSEETLAIFAIPQGAQQVTFALGHPSSPLLMEVRFDEQVAAVVQPQVPRQSLSEIPGCQREEVSISEVRLYASGSQYRSNKLLASGEDGYLEYTWNGGGNVEVTPAGTGEKIWGSYQAWTYIAPTETTTYTLTPTADRDCATTFTVTVY